MEIKQITEWHFIAPWDPIKNVGGGMKISLWPNYSPKLYENAKDKLLD